MGLLDIIFGHEKDIHIVDIEHKECRQVDYVDVFHDANPRYLGSHIITIHTYGTDVMIRAEIDGKEYRRTFSALENPSNPDHFDLKYLPELMTSVGRTFRVRTRNGIPVDFVYTVLRRL